MGFAIEYKTCRCGAHHASSVCPRCGWGSVQASGDYPADEGREHVLQAKVARYCEENGFYHFHDRSRGENAPGHPDSIIALPGGRTLWLELKARNGRLSDDQKRVALILMALGHEFHVVRSYRHFRDLVEGRDVA